MSHFKGFKKCKAPELYIHTIVEDKIPSRSLNELTALKNKWYATMTKLTIRLGQFDRKTIKARAEYLRLFKKELDRKTE